MKLKLLDKTYSDESLYDIERDVYEAVQESNSLDMPKDKYGFRTGTFHALIYWTPD